jgi:hypothetical protein
MLSVENNSKRRKSRTSLTDSNSRNKSESKRPSSDLSKATSGENIHEYVSFDNFQHIIYEKAAIIYGYLKGEENAVLPTFQDERIKRRSYSLAFGAKKCK